MKKPAMAFMGLLICASPGFAGATIDEPAEWADFSLPRGIEIHAEHEMLIEGIWKPMGRNHVRVTRDWVESRQWSTHAGFGEVLEVYVHACDDTSVDYRPSSRRAGHWDLFQRLGTALGGSEITPFDPVRTLLVSIKASRGVRVESDDDVVRYRFTRMDYDPKMIESELVADHAGRVLEHTRMNRTSGKVTSRTRYSDYTQVAPGQWFPLSFDQQIGADPAIEVRWRVTDWSLIDEPRPPKIESFPVGTRHFDEARGVEIDEQGYEITKITRTASGSAGGIMSRIKPSAVFATFGVGFLLAAAWVYRRRAAG